MFYEEAITHNHEDDKEKEVVELLKDFTVKHQQKKKRGAPFKGEVTDQDEEGFKVQR